MTHLTGLVLTMALAAVIFEESAMRQKLARAEQDAEIWRTFDRIDALTESIRSDEQRLREICAQYPRTAGC